jgi:type VI secretion system FHA domain protein
MGLRLEIVSHQRRALGDRGIKGFGADGGTLGRSLESDWVLSDPQRHLSSRHATIDYRSGSYYIVDTSTNGVYVNDAAEAVGRGKPQRLFNGDRLRIGDYVMLVHLAEDDEYDHTATYTEDGHVDPVDRAQRVAAPDPTGRDLVDPFQITGVGIGDIVDANATSDKLRKMSQDAVDSLSLVEDDPPPPPPRKTSTPTAPAKRAPAAAAAKTTAAEAPARERPLGSRGLEAFFRGAGLKPRALNEEQSALLLHLLGQLIRELIVGINENLYLRAEHKNLLRQPHTLIQPSNNNPLKFSAGIDEALTNLLFREADEYIAPVEAVRECFRNIRVHQQAFVAAVTNGLRDYMERLDPQEIESKISKKPSPLMGAANKLKYWDSYKELYDVVTQHSPGQFPQAFIDDLAQAYELEIERQGGQANKPKAKTG